MPVRLATPRYVTGLSDVVSNPVHATGVGLLLYGCYADSNRNLGGTGRRGYFAIKNTELVFGENFNMNFGPGDTAETQI